MSDLIDRTELPKKVMPKNPDAEFHCVSVKDIMAMPSARSAAVRMAYYKGLNDGIKKCTERLKRLNDEEK